MSVLIQFMVYALLVIIAVWTIWRFFIRNPLAEWANSRLNEERRRRIKIKNATQAEHLINPDEGTYVDFEEVSEK